MLADKWRVVVTAETQESIPRLVELMRTHGVDFQPTDDPDTIAKPGAWVTLAPQSRGVSLPNSRIAIIGEADLSGRRRTRKGRTTRSRSSSAGSLNQPRQACKTPGLSSMAVQVILSFL